MRVNDYGDVRLSRSIAGAGLSGISVTSLSFKTPYDMSVVPPAAAVILSGILGIPTFYINSRTYRDGIWTVECLDRAAFMDTVIVTKQGSQEWHKSDGKYSMTAVQQGLQLQCGVIADMPYPENSIPCEQVDGKTWQTLLGEMAEAYCGCFCCFGTNHLDFIRYDEVRSAETITHYSRIHDDGEFSYSSVKAGNGKETVLFGAGAPQLSICNDLVYEHIDTPPASTLYSGILNHSFTGWSVDNAVSVMGALPIIGGELEFGTVEYIYGDEIDLDFGVIYPITVPANAEAAGLRVIGPAEAGWEFAIDLLYRRDGTDDNVYFAPLADAVADIPEGSHIDLYFINTRSLSEVAEVFADEECSAFRFQCYGSGGAHVQMIWVRKTVQARKRVTRADAHISGGELVMSVGGDIPQMGEIARRGLLQQKLDNAVSTDKVYGTMKFNPYGQVVVVPNESEGSS